MIRRRMLVQLARLLPLPALARAPAAPEPPKPCEAQLLNVLDALVDQRVTV